MEIWKSRRNSLSIYLSIDLSTYLSIYLSIHLSTYLPVYWSIYLSTYLSAYLSLSTYLPSNLSARRRRIFLHYLREPPGQLISYYLREPPGRQLISYYLREPPGLQLILSLCFSYGTQGNFSLENLARFAHFFWCTVLIDFEKHGALERVAQSAHFWPPFPPSSPLQSCLAGPSIRSSTAPALTLLRLARTHARHEPKPKPISRLELRKGSHPPTSNIYIYIYHACV